MKPAPFMPTYFEKKLEALLNACCTRDEVLSLRRVVFHHEDGERECRLCLRAAKIHQPHAWHQHVIECPFALAMRRVGLAPLTWASPPKPKKKRRKAPVLRSRSRGRPLIAGAR